MAMTVPMSSPVGSPVGSLVSTAVRRRTDPSSTDVGHPGSVAVPGLSRPIRVKLASDRDEFEQAFGMVADRYKAKGYEAAGAGAYRFTPHHALPGTVTFVAKEGDRVVATLSLVPDNTTLGLPMESLYGDEVARLRGEGRVLAEVTCLAEEGLNPREFLRVFSALMRLMSQYHVRNGGDTWVITVNPRHRSYYSKVLGFQPLGPCRSYSTVGDHPAEAFYLDVDDLRERAPGKYWEFFGELLPWSVLTPVSRPADHAVYFGSQSTQADSRTIMKVLAAGRPAGASTLGLGSVVGPLGDEAGEATATCGSWHSRQCSLIGAGY